MYFIELDNRGIALGNMPEDLKSRKKFITDFYVNWIAANPGKKLFFLAFPAPQNNISPKTLVR